MGGAGMWQTTDLVAPLAERGVALSREQVYRLVTGTPERLNVYVLAALCDIFDCSPSDLIEPVLQPVTGMTLQPNREQASGQVAERAAGGGPDPAAPRASTSNAASVSRRGQGRSSSPATRSDEPAPRGVSDLPGLRPVRARVLLRDDSPTTPTTPTMSAAKRGSGSAPGIVSAGGSESGSAGGREGGSVQGRGKPRPDRS
jgi:DNA-binding Xre family transcriptional regulator